MRSFRMERVKCIEAEIPFELPEGWCWSRLGSLFSTITGNTPSTKNASLYGNDYPFISQLIWKLDFMYTHQKLWFQEKVYRAGGARTFLC